MLKNCLRTVLLTLTIPESELQVGVEIETQDDIVEESEHKKEKSDNEKNAERASTKVIPLSMPQIDNSLATAEPGAFEASFHELEIIKKENVGPKEQKPGVLTITRDNTIVRAINVSDAHYISEKVHASGLAKEVCYSSVVGTDSRHMTTDACVMTTFETDMENNITEQQNQNNTHDTIEIPYANPVIDEEKLIMVDGVVSLC